MGLANDEQRKQFCCCGKECTQKPIRRAMSRKLVNRRSTIVGYGGFGISDKTTDVVLKSCVVMTRNTTLGIRINTSTSNVVTQNNSAT